MLPARVEAEPVVTRAADGPPAVVRGIRSFCGFFCSPGRMPPKMVRPKSSNWSASDLADFDFGSVHGLDFDAVS
ncbi:MAG: hypothetical protein JXB62_05665 [Pirellulales bacterium]|nr:hypothetical protein [Pirellulales bacterium]